MFHPKVQRLVRIADEFAVVENRVNSASPGGAGVSINVCDNKSVLASPDVIMPRVTHNMRNVTMRVAGRSNAIKMSKLKSSRQRNVPLSTFLEIFPPPNSKRLERSTSTATINPQPVGSAFKRCKIARSIFPRSAK